MTYRVLVLGACCAGMTSLHEALRDRFNVIESDHAVLARAGGIWPTTASENRRLVVEVAAEALALDEVIHLTSFVPTELIRAARDDGFTVALLRVPRAELELRNEARQRAGGHGDMTHWFTTQLESYADLDAEGLIDVEVDGTQPVAHVAATVAALATGPGGEVARRVPAVEPIEQAYGALAETYIDLFGSTAAVHGDDLDLITRHLAIAEGAVLDVGCGPGHLTAHLRALGVDATGIDLVPEFVAHARAVHPDGTYELGSMRWLPAADGAVAGILSWYSLIHLPPDDVDDVLAELRRVLAPGGSLVAGFFEGDDVVAFDHKVATAYSWPADELAARLRRAGFTEVERQRRPPDTDAGTRAHAALVAVAT